MSEVENPEMCEHCGLDPARGFAEIEGKRYCHEGVDPTCFMRENRARIVKEESLVIQVVNRRNKHFRISSVA